LSPLTSADGRGSALPSVAGFTLIEVLVALALVAALLSSIGLLVATTVRGTRSIERHLTELETIRAIATALPDREQLVPGRFSGEVADLRWRVDVAPFAPTAGPSQPTSWLPQLVTLTVQSLDGAVVEIDTVRLHRRTAK
jgi:general secretion pathway protein I